MAADGSATSTSLGSRTATGKKSDVKKPFLACKFCRGRKIQCGPGPKLPQEIEAALPPGPRTCNQCHKRGQICKFPEASRRGLRGGKPSRLVVYGPDNRFRIIDAEESEGGNDLHQHDGYDSSSSGPTMDSSDPEEGRQRRGKRTGRQGPTAGGKSRFSATAGAWSPMRFIAAVDSEILKKLTAEGVLLPVSTAKQTSIRRA